MHGTLFVQQLGWPLIMAGKSTNEGGDKVEQCFLLCAMCEDGNLICMCVSQNSNCMFCGACSVESVVRVTRHVTPDPPGRNRWPQASHQGQPIESMSASDPSEGFRNEMKRVFCSLGEPVQAMNFDRLFALQARCFTALPNQPCRADVPRSGAFPSQTR